MIEVDKLGLTDLPDIIEFIGQRPERFILYCDDLSFEADEPGYKALKVVLDGSISTASDNVLIYATSNRRHLIPEFMHENLATRHVDGEIHPGEATEEKISLSERFGLWLSFYPFDQEQYLEIVRHWLSQHGISRLSGPARQEALRWALARGSRNGRVARQFARDWAGQQNWQNRTGQSRQGIAWPVRRWLKLLLPFSFARMTVFCLPAGQMENLTPVIGNFRVERSKQANLHFRRSRVNWMKNLASPFARPPLADTDIQLSACHCTASVLPGD